MIEVRPIRQEESLEFLRVLCGVFELDLSRAEGIFYSEPLFDLSRKWALFDSGRMVSILTTVPLEFGWGRAYGIAGVATVPERRGAGLAKRLLDDVFLRAEAAGEGAALLFARERTLYERCSFEVLDHVVRLPLPVGRAPQGERLLTFEETVERYGSWASQSPARLRRDERRWRYWRWTLRMCTPVSGGYLCLEGNLLREAVMDAAPPEWPFGAGVHWLGLSTMADALGLPGNQGKMELMLMGRNVPHLPQMFMTDQF